MKHSFLSEKYRVMNNSYTEILKTKVILMEKIFFFYTSFWQNVQQSLFQFFRHIVQRLDIDVMTLATERLQECQYRILRFNILKRLRALLPETLS